MIAEGLATIPFCPEGVTTTPSQKYYTINRLKNIATMPSKEMILDIN